MDGMSPAARTARKPASRAIRHDPSKPDVVQAAQIAMLVMKKLRVNQWRDVVELAATTDVRERVQLTPEQQSLLDANMNVLPHLMVKPITTVFACDTCGLYGLAGKGAVGKKCSLTLHCPGALHKASSAAPRAPKAEAEGEGTGPGADT